MNREQLIKNYLHGELSVEDQEAFDVLCATDEDFAVELDLQVVYYADRSAALKAELIKNKVYAATQSKNKKSILLFLIIGLLLVGIFCKFYFFNSSSLDAIPMANLYLSDKHPSPSVLMSDVKEEALWTQSIKL